VGEKKRQEVDLKQKLAKSQDMSASEKKMDFVAQFKSMLRKQDEALQKTTADKKRMDMIAQIQNIPRSTSLALQQV
jgi:hypothetical protein